MHMDTVQSNGGFMLRCRVWFQRKELGGATHCLRDALLTANKLNAIFAFCLLFFPKSKNPL